MLSETQQELLEDFSELKTVGTDIADKINAWNEVNLDEDKEVGAVTPDMSGDTIVTRYTEHGVEEETVYDMLTSVGYARSDDSDDVVEDESDVKKPKDVSDGLNGFLVKCIEAAEEFPNFVSEIKLLPGGPQRKEEVRIIIPSDVDLRKLSPRDIRKATFLNFLRKARESAKAFSMTDEAFCFCGKTKEFLVILRPMGNKAHGKPR